MAKELARLGEQPSAEAGGVSWRGDARSLMRANLWLRSASRVIVRIAEFRATAFFELEKQAKRIDWSAWIGPGVAPEFKVTAKKSKLYHSDAIAERLLQASGSQLVVKDHKPPAKHHKQLFVVRMNRDVCTISADASGDLLHMRGYRQAIAKAPLRETIAAAMLLANDWQGADALLDPFCGSGTIPIEAALIARNIAPGMRRDFAFMHWPAFDARVWSALKAEAKAAEVDNRVSIQGSDRDAGAIEAAVSNAMRVGVEASIRFERRALSALEAAAESGLVATNPPYGKRVSEGGDIRNLYAQLGKLMRTKLAAWRLTLLSPEERLRRQLGMPVEPILATINGGIRVQLVVSSARFLQTESRG